MLLAKTKHRSHTLWVLFYVLLNDLIWGSFRQAYVHYTLLRWHDRPGVESVNPCLTDPRGLRLGHRGTSLPPSPPSQRQTPCSRFDHVGELRLLPSINPQKQLPGASPSLWLKQWPVLLGEGMALCVWGSWVVGLWKEGWKEGRLEREKEGRLSASSCWCTTVFISRGAGGWWLPTQPAGRTSEDITVIGSWIRSASNFILHCSPPSCQCV